MLPWTWFYGNGNENTGFLSIQLDIVGFLAVLGEGAVLANAEVASLSPITFLPRLMPAPQCLIRPFRPRTLHEYKGFATSIKSGNHRRHVNHVGHVLMLVSLLFTALNNYDYFFPTLCNQSSLANVYAVSSRLFY
jgi:hypothetical protein